MAPKTVFMFSGQGSQYYQMGKQLFDEHAVFREWMMRLDAKARERCGRSVLDAIYGSGKAEVFDRTLLTHPAIFMVEYALAQCLIHEGIEPDLTMGSSLGSFAAAVVAGHLALDDALNAVIEQAQSFEASCERGGMVAILASPDLYEELFLQHGCEIAAVNFDGHFAVAAAHCDLGAIEGELKRREVTYQRLAVAYAFHSRWIDNAEEQFSMFMHTVKRHPGRLPVACCAYARTLDVLPEGYFWRVVRQPIRFRDTVRHLEQQGPWRYVDVGPSGTLATFVKYELPSASRSSAHAVLTPYGQDRRNLTALTQAYS